MKRKVFRLNNWLLVLLVLIFPLICQAKKDESVQTVSDSKLMTEIKKMENKLNEIRNKFQRTPNIELRT